MQHEVRENILALAGLPFVVVGAVIPLREPDSCRAAAPEPRYPLNPVARRTRSIVFRASARARFAPSANICST